MSKKVSFGATPKKTVVTPNPDTWVEHHRADKMKRLTIDVPFSLHTRIKTTCAAQGVKIADEVRALLEAHFPGTK